MCSRCSIFLNQTSSRWRITTRWIFREKDWKIRYSSSTMKKVSPGTHRRRMEQHRRCDATSGAKKCVPARVRAGRNDKRGVDVAAFGLCFEDSGVPRDWEATERSMGVVLATRDDKVPERLLSAIAKLKKESNAIIIVSIHFGGNWGFEVPRTHVAAAKTLVGLGRRDVSTDTVRITRKRQCCTRKN